MVEAGGRTDVGGSVLSCFVCDSRSGFDFAAALLVRSRVRSDVHCNGREIKHCAHWLGAYEIELTPFLKPGKNTLAIRCVDRDLDHPFLSAAVALREAGGVRFLPADTSSAATWKAVPRSAPAEWTQVWFDDRAWPGW